MNRLNRRKLLRKYQLGGANNNKAFGIEDQDLSTGLLLSESVATPALEYLYPTDEFGGGKGSIGKGAATGALSGAAAGTAILPGIGTAVGAVIGGVAGAFTGKKKRDAATEAENAYKVLRARNNQNVSNSRLIGYDQYGTDEYALGGELKRLSQGNYEVEGRGHEDGGVKFPEDGVELEGGETVSDDYVFSDLLGFADKHKKIAKQLGKIEKKPLTRATRVSVEILRKKEAALREEQESLRAYLGADKNQNKKLQLGGLTDPDYTPPASTEDEYKKYLTSTKENRQVKSLDKFKTNLSPKELSRFYDINTYSRDKYNAYQKALDSGQNISPDEFGLSMTEMREFNKNPYLKEFDYYTGKYNDELPDIATIEQMVNPRFYDRVPIKSESFTDPNPLVPDLLPQQESVRELLNLQKKESSPYTGKLKLKPRKEKTKVGYINSRGIRKTKFVR